ncbi:HK97 gp10 family phage protein [Intrasporangium flavum]|uniref:HK97 gp10 family phage protein n=1 Tax=Intrasporangium flavum TaxID=1428657 RepID=UPI00096C739B|nr:HK97 gp10 family phage protein [Intrasporangium flavum]
MSLRIERHLDLSSLSAEVAAVAPAAVARAGEHIRAVSVARTPVETGRLAGSAAVHLDHQDGDATASITYDGPYARYQHERLDLRHETGQAKFLESALLSEADTALEIIATDIRRAL